MASIEYSEITLTRYFPPIKTFFSAKIEDLSEDAELTIKFSEPVNITDVENITSQIDFQLIGVEKLYQINKTLTEV